MGQEVLETQQEGGEQGRGEKMEGPFSSICFYGFKLLDLKASGLLSPNLRWEESASVTSMNISFLGQVTLRNDLG